MILKNVPSSTFPFAQTVTREARLERLELPVLELDKRHFWNMLVALAPALPSAESHVGRLLARELRILDVGCGWGADAIPLVNFWSGQDLDAASSPVVYVGVDIDPTAIESAAAGYGTHPNIRFLVADATRLSSEPALMRRSDIIVLRHPDLFVDGPPHVAPLWVKIFEESVKQMAPGALILVTTYRCDEILAIEEMGKALGLELLVSARNPFTGHELMYGDGDWATKGTGYRWRDRYVAVFTTTER